MKLYEGMFVIDAGRASRDWEGTLAGVNTVLEKHGAAIEKGYRFDERKLAYPIEGVRRSVYLLEYFTADPEAIAEMRVDLNLSEHLLRYLILRVDGDEAPETPLLGTATPVPADSALSGGGSEEEPEEPEPEPDEDEDEDEDEGEDEDEDEGEDEDETDEDESPQASDDEPETEVEPADDEADEKKEEA